MPLLSPREVRRLKLEAIAKPALEKLARLHELPQGKASEMRAQLVDAADEGSLDNFVRSEYARSLSLRRSRTPPAAVAASARRTPREVRVLSAE